MVSKESNKIIAFISYKESMLCKIIACSLILCFSIETIAYGYDKSDIDHLRQVREANVEKVHEAFMNSTELEPAPKIDEADPLPHVEEAPYRSFLLTLSAIGISIGVLMFFFDLSYAASLLVASQIPVVAWLIRNWLVKRGMSIWELRKRSFITLKPGLTLFTISVSIFSAVLICCASFSSIFNRIFAGDPEMFLMIGISTLITVIGDIVGKLLSGGQRYPKRTWILRIAVIFLIIGPIVSMAAALLIEGINFYFPSPGVVFSPAGILAAFTIYPVRVWMMFVAGCAFNSFGYALSVPGLFERWAARLNYRKGRINAEELGKVKEEYSFKNQLLKTLEGMNNRWRYVIVLNLISMDIAPSLIGSHQLLTTVVLAAVFGTLVRSYISWKSGKRDLGGSFAKRIAGSEKEAPTTETGKSPNARTSTTSKDRRRSFLRPSGDGSSEVASIGFDGATLMSGGYPVRPTCFDIRTARALAAVCDRRPELSGIDDRSIKLLEADPASPEVELDLSGDNGESRLTCRVSPAFLGLSEKEQIERMEMADIEHVQEVADETDSAPATSQSLAKRSPRVLLVPSTEFPYGMSLIERALQAAGLGDKNIRSFNFLEKLVRGDEDDAITEFIAAVNIYRPDIICFSVYDKYLDLTRRFIEAAKRQRPQVNIAIGGPSYNRAPEQIISVMDQVNLAVKGNDTKKITKAIMTIGSMGAGFDLSRDEIESLKPIHGLFAQRGETTFMNRLDEGNYSTSDILPAASPQETYNEEEICVITSLSCPNACQFYNRSYQIQPDSPQLTSPIKEAADWMIAACRAHLDKKYPLPKFQLLEENFFENRTREELIEFFTILRDFNRQLTEAEPMRINIGGSAVSAFIKDGEVDYVYLAQIAPLMREAGVVYMGFGLDAPKDVDISPRQRKPRYSLTQAFVINDILRWAGIETNNNMIASNQYTESIEELVENLFRCIIYDEYLYMNNVYTSTSHGSVFTNKYVRERPEDFNWDSGHGRVPLFRSDHTWFSTPAAYVPEAEEFAYVKGFKTWYKDDWMHENIKPFMEQRERILFTKYSVRELIDAFVEEFPEKLPENLLSTIDRLDAQISTLRVKSSAYNLPREEVLRERESLQVLLEDAIPYHVELRQRLSSAIGEYCDRSIAMQDIMSGYMKAEGRKHIEGWLRAGSTFSSIFEAQAEYRSKKDDLNIGNVVKDKKEKMLYIGKLLTIRELYNAAKNGITAKKAIVSGIEINESVNKAIPFAFGKYATLDTPEALVVIFECYANKVQEPNAATGSRKATPKAISAIYVYHDFVEDFVEIPIEWLLHDAQTSSTDNTATTTKTAPARTAAADTNTGESGHTIVNAVEFQDHFEPLGEIREPSQLGLQLRRYRYTGPNRGSLVHGHTYVLKGSGDKKSIRHYLKPQIEFNNMAGRSDNLPEHVATVRHKMGEEFVDTALVFEDIDGITLSEYVHNRLRTIPPDERMYPFFAMVINTLRAYRDTCLGRFVVGDIDPTAVMITDTGYTGQARYKIIDNDTTTPIEGFDEDAAQVQRMAVKPFYCSEDRRRRLDDQNTPVSELCLQRDDVFALIMTFFILLDIMNGRNLLLPFEKKYKGTLRDMANRPTEIWHFVDKQEGILRAFADILVKHMIDSEFTLTFEGLLRDIEALAAEYNIYVAPENDVLIKKDLTATHNARLHTVETSELKPQALQEFVETGRTPQMLPPYPRTPEPLVNPRDPTPPSGRPRPTDKPKTDPGRTTGRTVTISAGRPSNMILLKRIAKERQKRLAAILPEPPPNGKKKWSISALARRMNNKATVTRKEWQTVYNDLKALKALNSPYLNIRSEKEIEWRRLRVARSLRQKPPHGKKWTISMLAKKHRLAWHTVRDDLRAQELLDSPDLDISSINEEEIEARRLMLVTTLPQKPPHAEKWDIDSLAEWLSEKRHTVYNDLRALNLLNSPYLDIRLERRVLLRRLRLVSALYLIPPESEPWSTVDLAKFLGVERRTVYDDLSALDLLGLDRVAIRTRNNRTRPVWSLISEITSAVEYPDVSPYAVADYLRSGNCNMPEEDIKLIEAELRASDEESLEEAAARSAMEPEAYYRRRAEAYDYIYQALFSKAAIAVNEADGLTAAFTSMPAGRTATVDDSGSDDRDRYESTVTDAYAALRRPIASGEAQSEDVNFTELVADVIDERIPEAAEYIEYLDLDQTVTVINRSGNLTPFGIRDTLSDIVYELIQNAYDELLRRGASPQDERIIVQLLQTSKTSFNLRVENSGDFPEAVLDDLEARLREAAEAEPSRLWLIRGMHEILVEQEDEEEHLKRDRENRPNTYRRLTDKEEARWYVEEFLRVHGQKELIFREGLSSGKSKELGQKGHKGKGLALRRMELAAMGASVHLVRAPGRTIFQVSFEGIPAYERARRGIQEYFEESEEKGQAEIEAKKRFFRLLNILNGYGPYMWLIQDGLFHNDRAAMEFHEISEGVYTDPDQAKVNGWSPRQFWGEDNDQSKVRILSRIMSHRIHVNKVWDDTRDEDKKEIYELVTSIKGMDVKFPYLPESVGVKMDVDLKDRRPIWEETPAVNPNRSIDEKDVSRIAEWFDEMLHALSVPEGLLVSEGVRVRRRRTPRGPQSKRSKRAQTGLWADMRGSRHTQYKGRQNLRQAVRFEYVTVADQPETMWRERDDYSTVKISGRNVATKMITISLNLLSYITVNDLFGFVERAIPGLLGVEEWSDLKQELSIGYAEYFKSAPKRTEVMKAIVFPEDEKELRRVQDILADQDADINARRYAILSLNTEFITGTNESVSEPFMWDYAQLNSRYPAFGDLPETANFREQVERWLGLHRDYMRSSGCGSGYVGSILEEELDIALEAATAFRNVLEELKAEAESGAFILATERFTGFGFWPEPYSNILSDDLQKSIRTATQHIERLQNFIDTMPGPQNPNGNSTGTPVDESGRTATADTEKQKERKTFIIGELHEEQHSTDWTGAAGDTVPLSSCDFRGILGQTLNDFARGSWVLTIGSGMDHREYEAIIREHPEAKRLEFIDWDATPLRIADKALIEKGYGKVPAYRDRIFLQQGDARILPYHPGQFRVIWANQILGNIEDRTYDRHDDLQIATEALQALEPGGVIVAFGIGRPTTEILREAGFDILVSSDSTTNVESIIAQRPKLAERPAGIAKHAKARTSTISTPIPKKELKEITAALESTKIYRSAVGLATGPLEPFTSHMAALTASQLGEFSIPDRSLSSLFAIMIRAARASSHDLVDPITAGHIIKQMGTHMIWAGSPSSHCDDAKDCNQAVARMRDFAGEFDTVGRMKRENNRTVWKGDTFEIIYETLKRFPDNTPSADVIAAIELQQERDKAITDTVSGMAQTARTSTTGIYETTEDIQKRDARFFFSQGITVQRNNIQDMPQGQVMLRVRELFRMTNVEERDAMAGALKKWLDPSVATDLVHPAYINMIIEAVEDKDSDALQQLFMCSSDCRVYFAVSEGDENGTGELQIEGVVAIVDGPNKATLKYVEVAPWNRSDKPDPRFIGVGRELIFQAFYQEMRWMEKKRFISEISGKAAAALEKEDIVWSTVYTVKGILKRITRRIRKTVQIALSGTILTKYITTILQELSTLTNPARLTAAMVERARALKKLLEGCVTKGSMNIYYVCASNVNRSVKMHILTEDFARKSGLKLDDDITVSSGAALAVSSPDMIRGVRKCLQDAGVDKDLIDRFQSLSLDTDKIKAADVIIVAERSHMDIILKSCPEAAGKVFMFTELLPADNPLLATGLDDIHDQIDYIKKPLEKYLFEPYLSRLRRTGTAGTSPEGPARTATTIDDIFSLYEVKSWTVIEEDPYVHGANVPYFSNGKGGELFDSLAYQRRLPEDSDLTAHFREYADRERLMPVSIYEPSEEQTTPGLKFRPRGAIPFFDKKWYVNNSMYEKALKLLLLPKDPSYFHMFNIRLSERPWLGDMCITTTYELLEEFQKRDDVEFLAEIRTKQDSHSAILVKFVNDKQLYVFDRCAGQHTGLPEELLLGWYAPVYTGENADDCPGFSRYRRTYEAYMPQNFVLNRNMVYVKGATGARTATADGADEMEIFDLPFRVIHRDVLPDMVELEDGSRKNIERLVIDPTDPNLEVSVLGVAHENLAIAFYSSVGRLINIVDNANVFEPQVLWQHEFDRLRQAAVECRELIRRLVNRTVSGDPTRAFPRQQTIQMVLDHEVNHIKNRAENIPTAMVKRELKGIFERRNTGDVVDEAEDIILGDDRRIAAIADELLMRLNDLIEHIEGKSSLFVDTADSGRTTVSLIALIRSMESALVTDEFINSYLAISILLQRLTGADFAGEGLYEAQIDRLNEFLRGLLAMPGASHSDIAVAIAKKAKEVRSSLFEAQEGADPDIPGTLPHTDARTATADNPTNSDPATAEAAAGRRSIQELVGSINKEGYPMVSWEVKRQDALIATCLEDLAKLTFGFPDKVRMAIAGIDRFDDKIEFIGKLAEIDNERPGFNTADTIKDLSLEIEDKPCKLTTRIDERTETGIKLSLILQSEDEDMVGSAIIRTSNSLGVSRRYPDLEDYVKDVIWNETSNYFQEERPGEERTMPEIRREYYSLNWMASINFWEIKPEWRGQHIGQMWYRNCIEPYLLNSGFKTAVAKGKCLDDDEVWAFWNDQGFSQRFPLTQLYDARTRMKYICVKKLTAQPQSDIILNSNPPNTTLDAPARTATADSDTGEDEELRHRREFLEELAAIALSANVGPTALATLEKGLEAYESVFTRVPNLLEAFSESRLLDLIDWVKGQKESLKRGRPDIYGDIRLLLLEVHSKSAMMREGTLKDMVQSVLNSISRLSGAEYEEHTRKALEQAGDRVEEEVRIGRLSKRYAADKEIGRVTREISEKEASGLSKWLVVKDELAIMKRRMTPAQQRAVFLKARIDRLKNMRRELAQAIEESRQLPGKIKEAAELYRRRSETQLGRRKIAREKKMASMGREVIVEGDDIRVVTEENTVAVLKKEGDVKLLINRSGRPAEEVLADLSGWDDARVVQRAQLALLASTRSRDAAMSQELVETYATPDLVNSCHYQLRVNKRFIGRYFRNESVPVVVGMIDDRWRDMQGLYAGTNATFHEKAIENSNGNDWLMKIERFEYKGGPRMGECAVRVNHLNNPSVLRGLLNIAFAGSNIDSDHDKWIGEYADIVEFINEQTLLLRGGSGMPLIDTDVPAEIIAMLMEGLYIKLPPMKKIRFVPLERVREADKAV